MITIEKIRNFIQNEKYEYYTHAITEAKKDGVEPEDIVYVLLTGKIIEKYPDRQRVLVCGKTLSGLPLHVVCNHSDSDMIYIVTVYIPSDEEWTGNYQQRKRGGKR
ncbi:MAG: DUF4258 domain-containing protein [Nitrospirae bacterium]|nr:MAG: DUF4258 domain-containing protein [Nitrospirota bacterium]